METLCDPTRSTLFPLERIAIKVASIQLFNRVGSLRTTFRSVPLCSNFDLIIIPDRSKSSGYKPPIRYTFQIDPKTIRHSGIVVLYSWGNGFSVLHLVNVPIFSLFRLCVTLVWHYVIFLWIIKEDVIIVIKNKYHTWIQHPKFSQYTNFSPFLPLCDTSKTFCHFPMNN